jgi:diguanylate cyclase (GGDEF)-like protein/PAS domain S-box-containing protein
MFEFTENGVKPCDGECTPPWHISCESTWAGLTTKIVMPPQLVRARAALSRVWLPAIFGAYGLIYIGWLLLSHSAEGVRSLVANLGYLPLGATSALIALRISRVTGLPARQRWAWRLMMTACLVMTVADIAWSIDENLRGLDPSGSWANVGYLLYYVVLLCGLVLFPQPLPSGRDTLYFALDLGIVMVSGAMAVWHFVILPTLHAPTASAFVQFMAVCYPIGDLLVLLGVTTILLRCPRGPRRRPLEFLAASSAACLIADVIRAHSTLPGAYRAGTMQDVPYMMQYVLFAAALALEERRLRTHAADDDDPRPGPFQSLPHVSLVGGYTLMIVVAWDHRAGELAPLIVGATLLTVFVVIRQIVVLRDNVRLQRERTLLASDARFKSLVTRSSDIVSIMDADGTMMYVSPSATSTLGYNTSQLLGRPFVELVHPDDLPDATGRLREILVDPRRVMTARWRIRHCDETWIQTENICTNLLSEANIRGLVVNTRDISGHIALEAQLTHQAFHDPLTGLANRPLFLDRVHHALSRRRGNFDTLGVLFIDLDHFKTVNDSLGHAIGDALLKAAAERLHVCLRAFDTAARLGGDEFAVLVDDTQRHEQVLSVGERIARAFQMPFMIEGREVTISASVGVALPTADQSAEDLLRNADLAMYLAKSRGRRQAAMFDPAMHAAVSSRLELQTDLKHALDRGQLSIVYQPIHALETQALVGAEALLRWSHPTRGSIPPRVFVPIAEETGLIVAIGRWVLQRACLDARDWQLALGRVPLRVSVNLSSRQIVEATLFDDVQGALITSGLTPGMLMLELTESVLVERTDQALAIMNQLRSQGVRLAIDDFGTGYSSLSYLQKLPIDTLKIDQSFVDRLGHDTSAVALTRAIIALGQSLALTTVAEGIEDAHQAEELRKLGCHFGQGFFYGAPMTSKELEAYARRRRAMSAA